MPEKRKFELQESSSNIYKPNNAEAFGKQKRLRVNPRQRTGPKPGQEIIYIDCDENEEQTTRPAVNPLPTPRKSSSLSQSSSPAQFGSAVAFMDYSRPGIYAIPQDPGFTNGFVSQQPNPKQNGTIRPRQSVYTSPNPLLSGTAAYPPAPAQLETQLRHIPAMPRQQIADRRPQSQVGSRAIINVSVHSQLQPSKSSLRHTPTMLRQQIAGQRPQSQVGSREIINVSVHSHLQPPKSNPTVYTQTSNQSPLTYQQNRSSPLADSPQNFGYSRQTPKQPLHSYQISKAAASRPQQPSTMTSRKIELERMTRELRKSEEWLDLEELEKTMSPFDCTEDSSPRRWNYVPAKAKMEAPKIDKPKKLETLSKAKEASMAESPAISKVASETELPSGTEITSKPRKTSKPRQNRAEPELCEEQRALVDLILSGRNVFYTGSAGCGKSTVLKAFVKELKGLGKTVNIIAPTGRAALDINGQTFWTYAGWTPLTMKKPLQELKKAAHGKFVRERLRKTDVLVIDEISMVENHHFERLNELMQEARGETKAFGGVQLVVTGDFCQLPPVKPFAYCMICGRELNKKIGNVYKCPQHGTYGGNAAQVS